MRKVGYAATALGGKPGLVRLPLRRRQYDRAWTSESTSARPPILPRHEPSVQLNAVHLTTALKSQRLNLKGAFRAPHEEPRVAGGKGMARSQTLAVVNSYLSEWEYSYARSEDGKSFRVLCGSTAVYISAYDFGDGTVVNLEAPVLIGIKKEAPIGLLAMLNREVAFGKFCFDGDNGVITVESELLGDFMDQEELYKAILAVGLIADEWDDRLQADFGGERHLTEEEPQPHEQEV